MLMKHFHCQLQLPHGAARVHSNSCMNARRSLVVFAYAFKAEALQPSRKASKQAETPAQGMMADAPVDASIATAATLVHHRTDCAVRSAFKWQPPQLLLRRR
jgi:hypothetical protein